MKFYLLVLLFLFWAAGAAPAQDLYNYENSAAFADHLSRTKQFSLAVAEYERVLFLHPTTDSLRQRLLWAYQKAGNTSYGTKRAEDLYPQPNQMPAGVARTYVQMLLREKAFGKADAFLQSSLHLPPDDRLLFSGTSQALRHNWFEAKSHFRQVSPGQRPVVADYQRVVAEALAVRPKSPALAATLSTLLPGAGKVYTRDWKDGLISFVMVGTSAWQAYRGFNQSGSGSTRGWIFTSVTLGFYAGNIFGSHKSARVYNQRLNQKNQEKIESIFYADF